MRRTLFIDASITSRRAPLPIPSACSPIRMQPIAAGGRGQEPVESLISMKRSIDASW